ncbi:MAG: adenosylcobinamide-GDP ribazoletransferase [Propionibacteriaceae bacterium]|nr:adenosylcobinamide-GDP ribazoletransferase [Propionibacteriaceae bacterium]
MRGVIEGLHAAVSFFTWIPVPPVEVDEATPRRAILALPWVGLGVGAVAAVASGLVLWAGAGALLAAVLGLAVLAGLTGAMHLDGVADTADALGSRTPPAEALVIMRQSDIGPMGVAALVLVLLVDVAALASPRLDAAGLVAALAVAPMVGRVAALLGTTRWFAPAHDGGFGALFARVTSPVAFGVTAAAVLGAAFCLGLLTGGVRGGVALVVGSVVGWGIAAGWVRHLLRRLGGLTGDTFGSLIEITQAALLIAVALAW